MAVDGRYCCIECSGPLAETAAGLECAACAASFPIVGEIPILRHRPYAVLAAATIEVKRAAWHLKQTRTERHADVTARRNEFAARAQRVIQGRAHHVGLLRTYMDPALNHAASGRVRELDAIDWLAVHANRSARGGWESHAIFPYFYQDWGGAAEFSRVRDLLVAALLDHRADGEALVVVGAGACGMVHATAAHFDRVYAIDTSLAMLSIARGVLRGDSFTVHLPAAQWATVRIGGASPPASGASLAVADAAALPFRAASVSAVLTQYLMDVVGNPPVVIQEIGRVLKPGGVWVNFSRPFQVLDEPPGFGPPAIDEIPGLLLPFGFEVRRCERQTFALMDVTGLDPQAAVERHVVQFFTACRSLDGQDSPRLASLSQLDAEGRAAWWSQVPSVTRGRSIQIARDRVFAAGQRQQFGEVRLGNTIVTASDDMMALFESVLMLIDGRRSAREIFSCLRSRLGVPDDPSTFRELLEYLFRYCGAISFDRAPSSS